MRFGTLLVLLFGMLMSACAVMGDRTVNITEAQIQGKLNKRLAVPISLMKIFDVSLSNSLVKFDSNTGRMHATLDTLLNSQLLNQSLTGKLGISGKLRFDAASNTVVLDEPAIENIDLEGMNGKQKEIVNALAKSLGSEMLSGLTLYTVKPEDLKIGTTQYQPKDLQVTNKGLQITLTPLR